MTPKAPVLDLFIGRDGEAWRLYVAATSWKPMLLRDRMDERGSVFPVAKPDPDDLDKFMFETDSPYEAGGTTDGGVEILAKGRSAVTLVVWLEGIVGTQYATPRKQGHAEDSSAVRLSEASATFSEAEDRSRAVRP
jgi:hypothetical protein